MKKLWLLLIAFVFAIGCRNGASLTSALEKAEKLMIVRPDSSLLILKGMDSVSLLRARHSVQARYKLLYSQALDKNYIDLTTDSIIRPAVNYYKKHGTPGEKGKAYYYLGRIYANAKNTEESVKAFIEAERHLEESGDSRMKGQIYSTMGNLLYKQYSFKEALEYYNKSLAEFKNLKDLRNIGLLYESKGLAYAMLEQFDSSKKNFSNAYVLLKNLKDTNRVLGISARLASCVLLLTHNADSAKNILLNTYHYYQIKRYPFNDYPVLGYLYLREHQVDSAEFCVLSMQRYAHYLTPRQLKGMYRLLGDIYEYKGSYSEALKYRKKSDIIIDSLYKVEKETIIQNLEQKYRTQQLKESYDTLQLRHRNQNIIMILGLMVLIFGFYILLIKRKQLIRKKNKEIEESKAFIEALGNEYNLLRAKYEEFVLKYTARQDEKVLRFKEALQARINILKKCLDMACLSGTNNDLFLSKFLKLVRLKSDKPYSAFSDIMEVADLCNNGIIAYLKERHPDLNYEDLCLCSMLSFGFTTDIISIIFNFTHPHSLYNRRFKLRKKLGLSSDTNIEKYILDLVEQLGAK